jgi:hypothetical protein
MTAAGIIADHAALETARIAGEILAVGTLIVTMTTAVITAALAPVAAFVTIMVTVRTVVHRAAQESLAATTGAAVRAEAAALDTYATAFNAWSARRAAPASHAATTGAAVRAEAALQGNIAAAEIASAPVEAAADMPLAAGSAEAGLSTR